MFKFLYILSYCLLMQFLSYASASYYLHPLMGPHHIPSPTFSPYIGKQDFNITALTTTYVLDNLCSVPPKADVNDRIVLYDGDVRGCSYETMARNIQKAGGIGFIYISQHTIMWKSWGEKFEEVSAGVFCLDSTDKSDITIPYLNVLPKFIRPVISAINNNENVIFQMLPDINPYLEPIDVFLICRIFSWILQTPWALANTLLAGHTLYWFYMEEQSFSFKSLPQTACAIETLSNLIRFIYVSLGPFLSWDIMSYPVTMIIVTSTWPLAFLTSLLIALYWKVVCDQIKALSTSVLDITKYRYIIIGIFFLELFACYFAAIMRAINISIGIWVPVSGGAEFIASGLLAYYFISQGRRLIAILKQHAIDMKKANTFSSGSMSRSSSNHNNPLQKAATKMTKWVIFSGIFTFIFLFVMLGLTTPFFYTKWGFIGFMYFTHIALLGISSTQIFAFRTQMKVRQDGSKTSTKSKSMPLSRGLGKVQTKIFETQEIEDFDDDEIELA